VAGYLTERLTAKAIYSASLVWGWADQPDSEISGNAGPFAALRVAGPAPEASRAAAGRGQSTLELEDLIPEWRGPGEDS
jgi:hypothetical protein